MSRFLFALLFFIFVGLLIAKLDSLTRNAVVSGDAVDKTWTQWAVEDFTKDKNKRNVVIIGSSLVLTPFNLADAHFHNSIVNGALHHKSDFLESEISEQTHQKISTFNFALPGLMPSDAYLITRVFLSGMQRPDLLIYGVGPRDFVDNLLASPASTDPYRHLHKLLPGDEETRIISLYKGKDWQSTIDCFLCEYFPLYANRENILESCTGNGQNLCSVLESALNINTAGSNSKFTVADLHNILPSYNPMAINIKQALFFPSVHLDPQRFAQNLEEYKARYRKINWDTFVCQSRFFMDVLKTARDNNIKVLVIAMPITSVNRQLLPGYISDLYKNNIEVLAKTFGASFLDLDECSQFCDQDFGDTVHLSTTGSTKLVKLIADYIAKYNLCQSSSAIPCSANRGSLATAGVKL